MGNINNNNTINNDIHEYTLEEVKKHCVEKDCWMIIKDYIYDVSDFIHPGGSIIRKGYGIDATELFYNPNIKHSSYAKKKLKQYCIGKLKH